MFESDEKLIEQILYEKQKEAAEVLVDRYYKKVYKEIYLKTSDEELALDLTQEVFISILKNLQQFDATKASFKTWINRIAGNKVIDYMRSRQHHEMMLTEILDDYDEEDNENVENNVINFMARQKVDEVLQGERTDYQQIFMMKAQQGYSFDEISQVMGVTRPVVKNRYYAVVKKMRKELQDYE